MWNILLDKILQAQLPLYITEKNSGKKFHQCGKGRHILYVIVDVGQKN